MVWSPSKDFNKSTPVPQNPTFNMDSLIEAFEVTQQELVNQKGQTESLQSNYQRSKDEAASLREENKSLSNENKKIKDFLLKDGVYIDDIDDLVTVKQTTDKLSDLYLIDSEGYSVVDAVRDLYGDVHSVSYKFHPFYTAFARYRLGGNYDLFEANIATSQETGGDVHISIEVYVDGNIVKRVDDICVELPDRLLLVTKLLYPEVAKQYHTNWKAVERNIRSVNNIIWQENRPLLEELAHRHLEQRPRNTQLLAILTAAIAAGSLGEKIGNLDEAMGTYHLPTHSQETTSKRLA